MRDLILKQADSLTVMSNMPPNSVDLILTDPPYKTITGGDSNGKNSIRPAGILQGNRKLFQYQKISIHDWMPLLFRVLKEGCHCYVFTNALNMREMLNEAEQAGFKLHNILCWKKQNCTPSQYYMKNCEYILFLRKGKAKWINHIGSSMTVHQFHNPIGRKLHPTEKPVELLKFYIENSVVAGDTVFDPFMGSGSTGVAALQCGADFIGIELDEQYYRIACQRLGMIEEESSSGTFS